MLSHIKNYLSNEHPLGNDFFSYTIVVVLAVEGHIMRIRLYHLACVDLSPQSATTRTCERSRQQSTERNLS